MEISPDDRRPAYSGYFYHRGLEGFARPRWQVFPKAFSCRDALWIEFSESGQRATGELLVAGPSIRLNRETQDLQFVMCMLHEPTQVWQGSLEIKRQMVGDDQSDPSVYGIGIFGYPYV